MQNPSDKRFCCTLCLCQMTAVLSAVSMVYLTVAIYKPAVDSLSSDMLEEPVMCTTIEANPIDSCNWTSCGEWCLSKSQGNCTQLHALVRNNGTKMQFQNCNNFNQKHCEYVKPDDKVQNCLLLQSECTNLTGQFNCTMGKCYNYTSVLLWKYRDLNITDFDCHKYPKSCREINDLVDCVNGSCQKIRQPYTCERRCVDLRIAKKNLLILSKDDIYSANCDNASVLSTNETIWHNDNPEILLVSCNVVEHQTGNGTIYADDCINGTLLSPTVFTDETNLTMLMRTYYAATKHPRNKGVIYNHGTDTPIPQEEDLVIYNKSRLLINMEGCVNTLKDECAWFMDVYGRDGQKSARARFPCFNSPSDSDFVVLRFDRQLIFLELMIASILPVTLFVVSCFTLTICSKSVVITDEGHFKCKFCSDQEIDSGMDTNGERAMAL